MATTRTGDTTVLDAGPAPPPDVCLHVLRSSAHGCWFDRGGRGGHSLLLVDPDQLLREPDGIWEALRAEGGAAAGGPWGFAGGWAGYLSYEATLPLLGLEPARRPPHPVAMLAHYPSALVIDHGRGRAWAVGRGRAGAQSAGTWRSRLERARHHAPPLPARPAPAPRVLYAGPSPAIHAAQVREVQRWIRAGDSFVANLTYRLKLERLADPAGAYAALRAQQRAPYGTLIHDGPCWVLCASPELLVRRRGVRACTRPIKGTRGHSVEDAAALAVDPKERAELTMIVDLERNDLGRVASTGSVRVRELFSVERHPGLCHLVATVEADVPGPAGTLLAALLPGGSVTGAPKRRTVSLLVGLETDARGVYTGTIGWCDDGGDMEWNIAIRTLVTTPVGSMYGTGGGITAESDPTREYLETRLKAQSVLRALGVVLA